jgi:hypothetical protein
MSATLADRIAYLRERNGVVPSEDATMLAFLYFLMLSRRAAAADEKYAGECFGEDDCEGCRDALDNRTPCSEHPYEW